MAEPKTMAGDITPPSDEPAPRTAPETEYGHAPHHGMSASQYVATRFSSLKPPMLAAPNPIRLLRMLTRMQWAFFAVAFFAWVWTSTDARNPGCKPQGLSFQDSTCG